MAANITFDKLYCVFPKYINMVFTLISKIRGLFIDYTVEIALRNMAQIDPGSILETHINLVQSETNSSV